MPSGWPSPSQGSEACSVLGSAARQVENESPLVELSTCYDRSVPSSVKSPFFQKQSPLLFWILSCFWRGKVRGNQPLPSFQQTEVDMLPSCQEDGSPHPIALPVLFTVGGGTLG